MIVGDFAGTIALIVLGFIFIYVIISGLRYVMLVIHYNIFRYRSECDICGQRGYKMNHSDNIYCKIHWKMMENIVSN